MENSSITALPKRWVVSPLITDSISRELQQFPPLLRQLLYNRGIHSAEAARAFVYGSALGETDPFLIKDMVTAVAILREAIDAQTPTAIYGDYDADGVTASALLFQFLQLRGLEARVYIPNRFDEGYGLNLEAVQQLYDDGIRLMITVDCGIRSVAEVALAKELGMQVILSDHHLPGEILPPANAIINPRQPGDPYPSKNLAGVGLAYKITEAFLQTYPSTECSTADWVDLVAIGTVADMAPLTGENRTLVRAGLEAMHATNRQGLYSLAQVAGIDLTKLNAGNIGFGIGPRLNAAGRLDSAMAAFELLTTRDLFQAGGLAQQLETQNTQRKDITHEIQINAIAAALQADPDAPLIFSASPDYNTGVVGLAASKVVEALRKPAIIGHQDEDLVVASCRSIPEFNITQALDACADLLERYGGHSAAAGFTVHKDNLPELLSRLTALAHQALDGLDLTPVLAIDREILLDKVEAEHVPGIFDAMNALQPTGIDNPDVLFCSRRCQVVQSRTVGKEAQHLKLSLRAGHTDYDCIAFSQGHWHGRLPEYVDIAYVFEINSFNGRQSLQLNIRDIKASE